MPTLSASDYTNYLKFKAAAASPIQQAVQTRDNATLYQSVINANVLGSQVAYVLTPALTNIQGNARVVGQPPNTRATRFNPATLSYAGLSGALGPSRVEQPGGLPTGFKSSQGTYHRIPQNAGWQNGA
jgi:hypothetical protein